MNGAQKVFDKQNLMRRLEDDTELARELVLLFLEDVETREAALAEAIKKGDLSGIEKEAHSLKGAAANLSVDLVRHAAAEIEIAGKKNDLETSERVFPDLRKAIEEAAAALKKEFL